MNTDEWTRVMTQAHCCWDWIACYISDALNHGLLSQLDPTKQMVLLLLLLEGISCGNGCKLSWKHFHIWLPMVFQYYFPQALASLFLGRQTAFDKDLILCQSHRWHLGIHRSLHSSVKVFHIQQSGHCRVVSSTIMSCLQDCPVAPQYD